VRVLSTRGMAECEARGELIKLLHAIVALLVSSRILQAIEFRCDLITEECHANVHNSVKEYLHSSNDYTLEAVSCWFDVS
jgi:hypothetical protein